MYLIFFFNKHKNLQSSFLLIKKSIINKNISLYIFFLHIIIFFNIYFFYYIKLI
jgi:hypothetical protein